MNAEAALAEQRRQANISNTIRQQELEFQKEQYEYQKQQDALNLGNDLNAYKQYVQSAVQAFTGTTYESAMQFLQSYGLANHIENMLTKDEWVNHGKQAGSYGNYLKAFLNEVAQNGW